MKLLALPTGLFLALLLCSPMLSAHHSTIATFSNDKTISIEGVVTDFRFRNPHVLIYVDVSDAEGVVSNWMVEGHSATGWRRAGWNKDVLKKGDRLRVNGNATLDGSHMVWLNNIEFLDAESDQVVAVLKSNEDPLEALKAAALKGGADQNKAAVAAKPAPRPIEFLPEKLPTGEPNFTGITRAERRLSPLVGRGPDANDKPIPYNEKGKRALAAFDIKNDPQVFCDPPGLVRQAGYTPYGLKIQQYPDHVTIEYEEYGSKRAIFFEPGLPNGIPTHLGDSVARYEGDSLIIESVNLLPNTTGHRGTPHSSKISVKEVYTRSRNEEYGTALTITTTTTDPEFFTEPWTLERFAVYDSSYTFIENECVPPKRERPPLEWLE